MPVVNSTVYRFILYGTVTVNQCELFNSSEQSIE